MKEWMQTFLEAEPPYKKTKINSKQLNDLSEIEHLSIEQYCSNCGKLRTFKSLTNPFKSIRNDYGLICMTHGGQYLYDSFANDFSDCYVLKFRCQHDCSESHYFTILINKLTIQKIGQYPTFAKEEVSKNLIKYKSLIPKYYPELTKAVSAYSQNMGVAAFVYLRRILEHLVESKYNLYSDLEGVKFIDKLHEVEKYERIIPLELDSIKNQIYVVLSKGVHEYDEEECIEIFSAVKFIVESILDTELIKKDNARKAKEAKKIIEKKLKKD